MLLTHALALSADQFLCKKKSLRVCALGENLTREIDLSRHEDNLLSNGRSIREGNARIGAGLEGSFFSFGETSLFVLNLSCERGIEGRLQSEPMGGMTQGAQRSLPYPDLSPLHGEVHVFPTL